MNARSLPLGLLCALAAFAALGQPAATLFKDGAVWTADAARPRAEAVLVQHGRIAFVGDTDEAAAQAPADAQVIDLAGRMLLPGFVESHSHPATAGLLNSKLQVIGAQTVAEVQDALREYAKAHPNEPALFGFGFPSALNTAINAAGVKGPYRADLDAVVSDRPVLLIALDAHSAWVNSKALEVAGIDKDTPDPLPGVHYYQRDKDGVPTGWMVEGGAFWPLLPVFGVGSQADFAAAFAAMLPRFSAMGITSVFDAGIPGGNAMLTNAMQALAGMEAAGQLPLRYHASVYIDKTDATGEQAVAAVTAARAAHASALIDIRTAKIANDGTIEGETAAVLKPYAAGGRGAVLLSGEPLSGLLVALRRANFNAHVHAIGDRTLRVVLDAVQTARARVPESTAGVVVAHAMLAANEDIARLKDLDVAVQTTPHWAHDLSGSLALYSRLLDSERGQRTMLLRDLHAAAPLLAFGADYPATGLPFAQTSPLHGIEIGLTRRAPGATQGDPYPPANQRMTLPDMLLGYTANGAAQLGMREVGTIAPGQYADLVVLERDLFHTPPHDIHTVRVDLTMLAGRVVYRREGT